MKKILLPIILFVCLSDAFAQTMVVKKSDGTIQEIAITDAVGLSFYRPCPGTATVTYEGKTYNTVEIGNQCWLKENLDVGTMINSLNGGTNSDGNQTNNAAIEKYCYHDSINNCNKYGGLYQWAEAVQYKNGATNISLPDSAFTGNVQGICPGGWHIPTNAEFQTLSTSVSENSNSLKAIGQGAVRGTIIGTGGGEGTNTSGFSALLAGHRCYNHLFYGLGTLTGFWSSTETSFDAANELYLYYAGDCIYFNGEGKIYGYSVRCVKD